MTSPKRRSIVRLSNAAASDFQGILRWTSANFGEEQTLVYHDALKAIFEILSGGLSAPGAKARPDIGSGIHILHVARVRRRARHVVLFRAPDEHRVEVVRILHDSMDLARHVQDE